MSSELLGYLSNNKKENNVKEIYVNIYDVKRKIEYKKNAKKDITKDLICLNTTTFFAENFTPTGFSHYEKYTLIKSNLLDINNQKNYNIIQLDPSKLIKENYKKILIDALKESLPCKSKNEIEKAIDLYIKNVFFKHLENITNKKEFFIQYSFSRHIKDLLSIIFRFFLPDERSSKKDYEKMKSNIDEYLKNTSNIYYKNDRPCYESVYKAIAYATLKTCDEINEQTFFQEYIKKQNLSELNDKASKKAKQKLDNYYNTYERPLHLLKLPFNKKTHLTRTNIIDMIVKIDQRAEGFATTYIPKNLNLTSDEAKATYIKYMPKTFKEKFLTEHHEFKVQGSPAI